jgi:hypothetical protein
MTSQESAEFIRARIEELVRVARRAKLDRLANILDLAADEAERVLEHPAPATPEES